MKRIVNGKRYDTETAEEIASAGSGGGRGDFRSYTETLFRTPKGAWFLAGSGGPLTKYAKRNGSERIGSEGIIPLDEDEAQDWLEAEWEWEVLEAYFAARIEDA